MYANLGLNGAEAPGLGGVSRVQIRGVIDGVLAETWFEATLRRCHQALVLAVAAAPGLSVLDSAPVQERAPQRHRRARRPCRKGLYRPRRSGWVRRRPSDAACPGNPDSGMPSPRCRSSTTKVDLAVLLTRDGVTDASSRRWLERAPQLRSLGLVVVAVLFGLILAINMSPLRRLLAVAGVVLLLAAAAGIGSHRAVVTARGWSWGTTDPGGAVFGRETRLVARLLPPVLTRLASAFLDGAAAAARLPLVLGGVAGLVLVAAALATRGRRDCG